MLRDASVDRAGGVSGPDAPLEAASDEVRVVADGADAGASRRKPRTTIGITEGATTPVELGGRPSRDAGREEELTDEVQRVSPDAVEEGLDDEAVSRDGEVR